MALASAADQREGSRHEDDRRGDQAEPPGRGARRGHRGGGFGLTVTEVRGYGRQRGKTEVYRGAEYEVKLLPKVKLEIAVPTDIVEAVVEAVARTANTGKIGDGKVFVMDLESALRIRTGDRDAAAIAG